MRKGGQSCEKVKKLGFKHSFFVQTGKNVRLAHGNAAQRHVQPSIQATLGLYHKWERFELSCCSAAKSPRPTDGAREFKSCSGGVWPPSSANAIPCDARTGKPPGVNWKEPKRQLLSPVKSRSSLD